MEKPKTVSELVGKRKKITLTVFNFPTAKAEGFFSFKDFRQGFLTKPSQTFLTNPEGNIYKLKPPLNPFLVKSMHRRMNPREQKRMMQRMGMNMDAVSDVKQVIIQTADKDIVIEEPEVMIMNVQGQKMYQIIGGDVSEQAPGQSLKAQAAKPAFSEEDVQLVADQTGKSIEKAKEALEECGGDLAKAILLLQS